MSNEGGGEGGDGEGYGRRVERGEEIWGGGGGVWGVGTSPLNV